MTPLELAQHLLDGRQPVGGDPDTIYEAYLELAREVQVLLGWQPEESGYYSALDELAVVAKRHGIEP